MFRVIVGNAHIVFYLSSSAIERGFTRMRRIYTDLFWNLEFGICSRLAADVARNHQSLNFRSAFAYLQQPLVAVVALDVVVFHQPVAAVDL